MENLSKVKKGLAINTLNLLARHNIQALPMKLYSDDDDVDIVIINKNQYKEAAKLLKSNQWYIKNNRSKLRERDKDFFKNKNNPYVIHLHQAFSWNTIPYLNSKKLWERKRKISDIPLPSVEDELLIIAAHSLFENQYIKQEEVLYGKKLLKEKIDIQYMKTHAKIFNWENGVELILKKLKNNESSLSVFELLKIKMAKLTRDILSGHFVQSFSETFNYFFIDWVWNYRIMLQKKLFKC